MVSPSGMHNAAGRRTDGEISPAGRKGRTKLKPRLCDMDRQRAAGGGQKSATARLSLAQQDVGVSMANLRKAARGRECTVRIPGHCNSNPETSVLAHYRLAGTCGTGCKPDDTQGAIACSACHDLIDGRKKTTDCTRDELRLMHAEGVIRTLAIWKKEGLLKV